MAYNIHPLFVHFPIALLFVYSLIKILPFKKWFPKVSWRQIEVLLLAVGVLGAFGALWTGSIARHLVQPNRQLVGMHSTFASISTWLYGLLLAGEILSSLTPTIIPKLKLPKITALLVILQNILTDSISSKILAFFGLAAISITGLLGGVMVYGTSADPASAIILRLLGINL